jgi:NADH-quinone oxidoreductase subunit L
VLWFLGLVASIITAVYMFRLLYLTFFGTFRGTDEQREHLHESPSSITIPLIILAGLATVGGFMGIPEVFGAKHALNEYLAPLFSDLPKEEAHYLEHTTELALMGVTVAITLVFLWLTSKWFIRTAPMSVEEEPRGAARLLNNKYYVDELYDYIFVKPIMRMSGALYRFVDKQVIDGIVNGVGQAAEWSGRYLRFIQTGNIGFYIFAMVIGIVAMILLNNFITLNP